MSARTKIVVLHMKELIYTCIFAALGILFIILLVMMFLPDDGDTTGGTPGNTADNGVIPGASETVYIPGIYTTELILGGHTVDVEVIVETNAISSIRLVNLSDAITTMYPLLQPTFDSICTQVYETQSLEDISYTADTKYTSLVLLEAVRSSLDKARPTATPTATPAAGNTTTPARPATTADTVTPTDTGASATTANPG